MTDQAAWAPSTVVAAGNLGAAYQLDAKGRANVLLTGTLTANLALTFANLVAGASVAIVLTQDATGSRTVTVNGVAVAVNVTPASVTVLKVYTPDGATIYVDAPGVDPAIVGVELHRTTNQSIGNAGFVVAQWEAKGWDQGSFANLGTANTKITVPAGLGGLYAVSWQAAWAGVNTTGQRLSYIRVNNATYPSGAFAKPLPEANVPGYVETPLAAGDYLEMVLYQDSGGAHNFGVPGGSSPNAHFTVRRLGPTPS